MPCRIVCKKQRSCEKSCRGCRQRFDARHASNNQCMNAGCWLQPQLQPMIQLTTWTDVARMHECGILLDNWPVAGRLT